MTAIVSELSSYFNSAERRIETIVDVEPITLVLDLAIPCALIINELLTNVYKHAFPRTGGQVRVTFAEEGGMCMLTVRDNGAGLPKGLDYRRTPSLGFQLVMVLVKQLRGTLQVDTNGGTAVAIQFKRKGVADGKT